MKTTRLVLTVLLVIILLLTAATSVLGGQEKVDVCHITGTYDFGGGEVDVGHVINIADPAYDKHIAHGDIGVWNIVELDDGSEVCTSYSPDVQKIVFVTSIRYKGNALGGLGGADAICQAHADAALPQPLPGMYKAWLSAAGTGNSVAERFSHSDVPYVLVNGFEVAANWTDLTDGSLARPINATEYGGPASPVVWTATNPDGSHAFDANTKDCANWGLDGSGGNAWVGLSASTDSTWTFSGSSAACGGLNRALYCFQQ